MQYEIDITSEHRNLFLYLREIILSHIKISEVKNAKQTSYKDGYSTVCMMRVRQGLVRVSFANGTKMQEQFPLLKGDSKIVRYLEFREVKEVDVELFEAMIKESLILNLEKYELRLLRCQRKPKF